MHWLYIPTMNISDYMTEHDLKDGDMAELVDHDRATISRVRRGVTKPSDILIKRIFKVTGGAVTANDFFHEAAA